MNIIINELKSFSKWNWWIFVILIIALITVNITWNWNIIEILILFLLNFLWNLFIMVMQKSYSLWKNKIWSIYQFSANAAFLLVSLYWLVYLNQSQYIIWQIAYTFAAIKNLVYFNYKIELKFLSEFTFIFFNLILFITYILLFKPEIFWIIQALWFCLITTWLVSIIDKNRFWLNILWIWFLTFGSLLWVFISYNLWNLDWIAFWYLMLTWTVFIYYLKLLNKNI